MRGKQKNWLVLGILIALVGLFSLFTAPKTDAVATGNPQINFQGKLTNPDGTNVTDGTYSITFTIYSAASAGTNIWSETQSSVNVSSGIFQVALGSVNTTLGSTVDFSSSSLYLGIKIGSDPEMTPRIQFTSAPYAFNADELDGVDSSGFVQLGPGSVQNDATTNPSVFLNKTGASGNILQLQKSGSDQFVIANSGAATFNNTVTLQNTSYTSNQLLLNNGQNTALPAIPGSYLPSLTVRDSQTTASRPLFFGYDNGAGTGWASYLTAGACGSFAQMCVDLGNGTTTATAFENIGTNLQVGGGDDGNFSTVTLNPTSKVAIGSATADATQVLFQTDSFNALADTATCSTTTNQGAMYYNTATNAMRSCINGNWEDLISTGGLGLLAFGVIADSSNAGTAGDIAGVSGYSNSPCKVVWTATQQVTVEPCAAFSGGRKLIIPSTALSTAGLAANAYANICISTAAGGVTTTGLPVLLTGNATETSATLPTFSANNPVLCLATVRASATAGNVGFIWDTRTFTTSQKQFASINSASNNGMLVIGSTTAGAVAVPAATGTGPVRGVIAATSGTASSTTINGIIATEGPVFVKFISGGTATVNNCLETLITTAGYGTSVSCTATTTASNYIYAGLLQSSISTSCTTTNTALSACQYSSLVDFNPSR